MKIIHISLISFFSFTIFSFGQEKTAGPVIKEFGKVATIENPDFKTNTSLEFKAIFDVMQSPENKENLSAYLETAARFLNMHAQAGVPTENLKVALVVHNLATKDILNNEAYRKKYGVANPNTELIKAFQASGAQVIVCGQSLVSRSYSKDELLPDVQVALSAMTALIQLQKDNYNLIKF